MFVSFRDTRQFKMPMICFTALLTGLDLWSYNMYIWITTVTHCHGVTIMENSLNWIYILKFQYKNNHK